MQPTIDMIIPVWWLWLGLVFVHTVFADREALTLRDHLLTTFRVGLLVATLVELLWAWKATW